MRPRTKPRPRPARDLGTAIKLAAEALDYARAARRMRPGLVARRKRARRRGGAAGGA